MSRQFERACETGNIIEAQNLIAHISPSWRNQALSSALLFGSADDLIIDLLLSHNANVDFKNIFGVWPLIVLSASWRKNSALKKLINNNANVNITDLNNNGVLHRAVFSRNIDTVKIILTADIDVNIKNIHGQTALSYLADEIEKSTVDNDLNVSMLHLIFEKELNILINENSNTAHAIIFEKNYREYDILLNNDRLDIKIFLIANNLLILGIDQLSLLLIIACQKMDDKSALFLMQKGADVYFKDANKESAFDILKKADKLPQALSSLKEKLKLEQTQEDKDQDEYLVKSL